MAQPMPPQGMPQPGQQPTPEQIAAMQRQLAIEAQKAGVTVQEYVERLKQNAMQQHHAQKMAQQQQAQQQAQQQQQGQPQGQQQPIAPGPPKPEALAVANFLKSQDLKPRTCIFQEKRKDMFRGMHCLHIQVDDSPRTMLTFPFQSNVQSAHCTAQLMRRHGRRTPYCPK